MIICISWTPCLRRDAARPSAHARWAVCPDRLVGAGHAGGGRWGLAEGRGRSE
jgi:hypothetical protein